jgi:hypothetical protein
MNGFARTYWFAWGLLVLTAAFTGVASVKAAFFGGLVAAVIPTLLTRVFERVGLSLAALIGAAAGVLWVFLVLGYTKLWGDPEDLVWAYWTLGLDLSIKAAGFAGTGLMAALVVRQGFGRAAMWGVLLAAAMTVLPYGFIAWVDYRRAGPIEVVCLISADVPTHEGPYRNPGAQVPVITPEESKWLKQEMLVVQGVAGTEVIDTHDHRYWPLWRSRFVYPGNPGGVLRRVVLVVSPEIKKGVHWKIPLSAQPDGITLAYLDEAGAKIMAAEGGSSSGVSLEIDEVMHAKEGTMLPDYLEISVVRQSPLGQFYSPQPMVTKPVVFFKEPPVVDKVQEKPRLTRPTFEYDEPKAK